MKILIIGKNGQVARELQRSCAILGDVFVAGSDVLNLASAESIRKIVREAAPHFIINAGAYTAVDKAESDSEPAFLINGQALAILGEEAKRLQAGVVHYSTDYVFDGTKANPYTETDLPNPLSIYGQSKLQGEKFLADSGAAHVTLRVSWVYGSAGHNFLNTMLRLGAEREELKIVADQMGAPTWSRHIAEATAHILKDRDFASKAGLYHLSPQGETSWHQFAQAIFDNCRQGPKADLKVKSVLPLRSEEYPTAACRPKNSLMKSEKIKNHFGIALPTWESSLKLVLQDKFVK